MANAVRKRARTTRHPNPKYETLADLLVLMLHSLYDVETQLIRALPQMVKVATNEGLREAFASHLEETAAQQERIGRALAMLGHTGKGKSRVEAIRGLIADAAWIIKSIKNPSARDAILIAAAQYIEHYEIAGYGTAREWARHIGRADVAELLDESLREESVADNALNALALGQINHLAVGDAHS